MSQPRPLPPIGRAYLAFVIAAGVSVIAYSIYDLWRFPVGSYWLVLLALTSFSSTFSIKIPNVSATISVSETFVFICALLYGPSPATIVIAIDGMIISIWRRHRRPHQVLFNAAEPALSLFVAAHAFFWLSGLPNADRAQFPIDVGRNLLPLAVFTFTYFLLNSGLNATIVALQGRKPLWPIWRQHFGWVLLNYFGATSVAALLVHNAREFNPTALGIVVPLLVISYLTFKTSMARVEESSRHVQELNKLYLSTIETLAMAVDAKDQITHGHIRRVQALAVGLARSLGVREDEQLKAIEAASLLHDMGKLAIPEHILNKPGKLSLAEFEKIKKHAGIGADILSAIDFPGPVVPIVRHHHEQWNGKGYPDGLAGSDIPIGARILAVVDCFDALTSDRPYRRALTPDEALAHLVQERGEAYDPLVVDTFGRVYKDIAPKDLDFGPHKKTLLEIAEVSQDDTLSTELPDWSPSPTAPDPHLLPLYESRQSFSAQTVLADASEEIGQRLLSLTPGRLVALFLHDAHTGEIVLTHASGTGAESLRGARIGLGERLSGWVAANRRTICNSDAALDLAGYDGQELAGFASCLSTPLTAGDELVGVITLYAADRHAFSDTHRRLVEQAARPLSHLVRGALELEKVQHATGAGAPAQLPEATAADTLDLSEEPCLCPVAAVALQIMQIGDEPGTRNVPELLLARAATAFNRDLRVACLLYRDGQFGLLAVLPHADSRVAETIAMRARDSVLGALHPLDAPLAADLHVLTGTAAAPADGILLEEVMEAARRRAFEAGVAAGLRSAADTLTQPRPFDDPTARWRHAAS